MRLVEVFRYRTLNESPVIIPSYSVVLLRASRGENAVRVFDKQYKKQIRRVYYDKADRYFAVSIAHY